MPIKNFTRCLSGDLEHVSKNGYYSDKKLKTYWAKLFNQHLKTHGLPDSYQDYIKYMVKAAENYAEAYNGKRWKIVKARVYEAEARQMLTVEGEKIEKVCARISKFMGFPVRAESCSVVDFYNYVAIMEPS